MSSRLSLWLLLCLVWACPALADEAAALVFFSGSPLLRAENGVVRPLRKGDSIASGETIDTADGRVQLRFRDGASLSLQPGTLFRVDSFRYSGNGGHAGVGDGVIMSLLKGSLRTVTGWLGKRDRTQYRIGTTVATIGIRGTEFGASLDGSGLTVSTYAGLVEVCSEVGCVDVAPSQTVWVRALNVRPEFRRESGAIDLKTSGALPETPLNREAMPIPQSIQPAPQMPPSPPPTQTPYQGPSTAVP